MLGFNRWIMKFYHVIAPLMVLSEKIVQHPDSEYPASFLSAFEGRMWHYVDADAFTVAARSIQDGGDEIIAASFSAPGDKYMDVNLYCIDGQVHVLTVIDSTDEITEMRLMRGSLDGGHWRLHEKYEKISDVVNFLVTLGAEFMVAKYEPQSQLTGECHQALLDQTMNGKYALIRPCASLPKGDSYRTRAGDIEVVHDSRANTPFVVIPSKVIEKIDADAEIREIKRLLSGDGPIQGE